MGFPVPSAEQVARMRQQPALFRMNAIEIPEPQPIETLCGQISFCRRPTTPLCERSIVDGAIQVAGEGATIAGFPVAQLFRAVVDDLEPFVLSAKYRFERPRPAQIAYMLSLGESWFQVVPESPSYPSGRVLHAHLLHHIARRFRDDAMAARLLKFAKQVERSLIEYRENYPSDFPASRDAAEKLAKGLVYSRLLVACVPKV